MCKFSGASSESSSAGTLLLNSLLLSILLESLLDLFSLVLELKCHSFVILLIVVNGISECILPGGTHSSIHSLGVLTFATQQVRGWLDTDVLLKEFLCGKVVHKVTSINDATIIILLLDQDLLKLLKNGLLDLVKFESHGLINGALLDSLIELLVNLDDNSLQPVVNLVLSQLYLLVHFDGLLVFFLLRLQLGVELVDLRVTLTLLQVNASFVPIVIVLDR